MLGHHLIKAWSATQANISLSSGEAEFYGVVKTSSRGLGILQLALDFGFDRHGEMDLEVLTDSSAAKGIAVRRGAGKVRHIETGALWVQQALNNGRFALSKVDGKKNVSDLMTKAVDHSTLVKFCAGLGLTLQ